MKKIERLLAIILALKKNGKMTASELKSLLEVNIRTIYRDMDAISQMEVPVISSPGKDGGYEIMEEYFLPVVSFSPDELLALQIGKKLLDIVKIPGFGSIIESAFLKINSTISPEAKEINQKTIDRIFFNLVSFIPESKHYFDSIRTGIISNKTLKICYFTPDKLSMSEREIEPWALTYYEGAWYLEARCLFRKEERTFRLDRIRKLVLTDNNFKLPADFDYGKYDRVESYRRDVLNQDKGTRILLKISLPLLERDKDHLLLTYYNIEIKDGWGYWEVNTNFPEDFIEYAVKHSNDVEIIEPELVRKQLKDKLQKIIDKY